MLIWKTQTLNVNIASLRYRCLLPLSYLAKPLADRGIDQIIVGSADPVPLTPETTAIVFVKSFQNQDIETCKQAYQLGTPIILDLCDNIFIPDYALCSNHVPSENFLQMAEYATAIVTTGEALKEQISIALAKPRPGKIAPRNITLPIVVIPDASETRLDIINAFRNTRWQRLFNLRKPAQRRLTSAYRKTKRRIWQAIPLPTKRQVGKQIKRQVNRAKRQVQRTKRQTRKRLQRTKKQVKRLLQLAKKQMRRLFQQAKRLAKQLLGIPVIKSEDKAAALPAIAPISSQRPPVELPQSAATAQPIAWPEPVEITEPAVSSPQPAATQRPKPAPAPPKPAMLPSQKQSKQPTPLIPDKWPKAAPNTKTILWFGNHGAKYGSFGMESVLEAAAAIKQLSRKLPLRLVIVSNSREKYQRYIAPLPFETVYLRWHPRQIYNYIQASDVTIVPNSQSVYSICKSANRTVLSLSQGTPVVASRTPSLDLLENCVELDNWESGLRQYLLNPEIGEQHVAIAQNIIAQNLSGEKIAQKWLALIQQVSQTRQPASKQFSLLASQQTSQLAEQPANRQDCA